MRDIINRIRPLDEQTLFCGISDPLSGIDIPAEGKLFGTFDQAVTMGRYVCECAVDLYRGEVRPAYEDNMVRIFDPSRVRIIHTYDTHCSEPLDEDAGLHQTLLEFSPDEGSNVLMVTGKLAHAGLNRIMKAMAPTTFTYEIRVLDKAVAAWFDTEFIGEEIGATEGFDLILLPGKTAGDIDALSERLGVRVARGTNCYSELPTFFELAGVDIKPDGVVKPKIIMLGRPGSGKTTYAGEIASTYEIPHVSVGDLIRAGVEEGDETAELAAEHLGRGEVIPHNVLAELVRSRILMPDMTNGYVLDGYPRVIRDVQWLTDMGMKPDAAVYLRCSAEEAQDRLIRSNKRDYAQVGKQIGEFEDVTLPVVEHYRNLPGFIEIDAEADDVMTPLYTGLEEMFRRCLMPDGRD